MAAVLHHHSTEDLAIPEQVRDVQDGLLEQHRADSLKCDVCLLGEAGTLLMCTLHFLLVSNSCTFSLFAQEETNDSIYSISTQVNYKCYHILYLIDTLLVPILYYRLKEMIIIK